MKLFMRFLLSVLILPNAVILVLFLRIFAACRN
jgi:hypothetical protein